MNMPDPCPADSLCDVAPGLMNGDINHFNGRLVQSSPAINNGSTEGAPASDMDGRSRDNQPDSGAYEWWEAKE